MYVRAFLAHRVTRTIALAIATALVIGVRSEAAETYHFEAATEGLHPSRNAGTVSTDGGRWRIDFDAASSFAVVYSAIIHTEDGKTIALNDSNHTWFPLKSQQPLAIDPYLFTFSYGEATRASNIRVIVLPADASDRGADAGKTMKFSYRIDTNVGSESLQGEVFGEIRLCIAAESPPRELPWRPFALTTGFASVDEAIRAARVTVGGAEWRSETHVSRRLAGGETLTQVIRRSISPAQPATVKATAFTIPPDYQLQEPVIGGVGSQ